MISSMHGRVIVLSKYRDEVELYLGAGATGALSATGVTPSMGVSSFNASSCREHTQTGRARVRELMGARCEGER